MKVVLAAVIVATVSLVVSGCATSTQSHADRVSVVTSAAANRQEGVHLSSRGSDVASFSLACLAPL